MTPEQVAGDDNKQPEPDDEHEYGERVSQKISESETFCEEEHRYSPCLPEPDVRSDWTSTTASRVWVAPLPMSYLIFCRPSARPSKAAAAQRQFR